MISRIVEPYPWVGHIPFAFHLVEQLKPSVIVELGTHSGNSFCAFCQASKDYSPSTKVYAIDTWQGDDHAGYYDESVYKELKDYVSNHFSTNGIMRRKEFNEGVHDFEDNSIDVLHIDGLHTYNAVRNDFETWLPKLKKDSLILFHDTNVFHEGFEVHRYWDELCKIYPYNFNFLHSNGLGVLLKNENGDYIKFIKLLNSSNIEIRNLKAFGELLEKYYNSENQLKLLESKVAKILTSKTYRVGLIFKNVFNLFKL